MIRIFVVVATILAAFLGGCSTVEIKSTRIPATGIAGADGSVWWLQLKRQRGCYAIYGEYYIEAKVTSGEDWDSPVVNVQDLRVASVREWTANKLCNNTYSCSASERLYNLGCPRICAQAFANDPKLGSASVINYEGGCPPYP